MNDTTGILLDHFLMITIERRNLLQVKPEKNLMINVITRATVYLPLTPPLTQKRQLSNKLGLM